MSDEIPSMIINTVALVTFVRIQGTFFLDLGSIVFIVNMTFEQNFHFGSEVTVIAFIWSCCEVILEFEF